VVKDRTCHDRPPADHEEARLIEDPTVWSLPDRRFKVLQPDPHGFDGDKDGVGCEA
jgi:hypothetical protein